MPKILHGKIIQKCVLAGDKASGAETSPPQTYLEK
jgi:hypothetical protein